MDAATTEADTGHETRFETAPEPHLPAARRAAKGDMELYAGPTVELSAASLEDERFAIEKILDQHLLYVEKTTDALAAFVRVIFLLNTLAIVLLLGFLGGIVGDPAALAQFSPVAVGSIDFFITGAILAVLSGLCAWWTYSTIAHRKRMLLERVFLKSAPAGPGDRARDLVAAMIEEGKGKSTLQFWLALTLVLASVAAFILGCRDATLGFAI